MKTLRGKIMFSILFVVYMVTLTGCSQKKELIMKKNFIVETKALSGFTNQIIIEKNSVLKSNQRIKVSSWANGRVARVLVNEGTHVSLGQPIIVLGDNIANYGSAVQRAKNVLDSSQLQYDTTKITLEKTIDDTSYRLQQAQTALDATLSSSAQQFKGAKQTLDSASTHLNVLKGQLDAQRIGLLNVLEPIIDFADTFLAYDSFKHYYTDKVQHLIGGRNLDTKKLAKKTLGEVYLLQDNIQNLSFSGVDNVQLKTSITLMQSVYDKTNDFLSQLIAVVNASISSVNLPQAQLDSYTARINGFKNVNQQGLIGLNAYQAQVDSVLSNTTNPSQNTMQESADVKYQQTKIQIEKNVKDAQLALDVAKNNYAVALKTKTSQLSLLKNQIDQAHIAYQDALTQYDKLTIRSPINGVISDIMVDRGQEITSGTPVFSISNTRDQLIDIYVSSLELGYLYPGQLAKLYYDGGSYTGTIAYLSSVAMKNGLYKVGITTQSDISLLGDVVQVSIPVKVSGIWLPLNIVRIVGENMGYVTSYNNGKLRRHTVYLGEIRGDNVKITNTLTGKNLVISNLDNYTSEIFQLVEKK